MPHPTSMFVKPASNTGAEKDANTGEYPRLKVLIPGPTREYLPDKGMLVPRNGYWLRRLKDGDVIEDKQGAIPPVAAQNVNPESAPEAVHETGKTGKGKKE